MAFYVAAFLIVMGVALFVAALIIFSVLRKHNPSADDAASVTALATNATDKPQVVQSVTRPMQVYYPPPPPGYYGRPDYDDPGYYGRRGYSPCPPGYTVQGGACRPYQSPSGAGWRTWNGCPPGYTVQGGACAPYRGY